MTLNGVLVFGLIPIGILMFIGSIPGCGAGEGGDGPTLIATGEDI